MRINKPELPKTPHNSARSGMLSSAIMLICGAMIVAGVFMPWFHITKSVWVVNEGAEGMVAVGVPGIGVWVGVGVGELASGVPTALTVTIVGLLTVPCWL